MKVELRSTGVVGGFTADFRDPTSTISFTLCRFLGNISTQSVLGTAVGTSSGGIVIFNSFD